MKQMTLKEMKIKTFSLIEEYYPAAKGMAEDEDVLNKINGVVNQIQMDLMKYRNIETSSEVEIEEDDDKIITLSDHIDGIYQIKSIHFNEVIDYEMPNDNTLILPNDFVGTFTIYYSKYPKLVKTIFSNDDDRQKEDDTFNFELDSILLEIMPYGIAADLLKMDMISNYGKYFYERYLEMKQSIDSRRSKGIVQISGGVDI